MPAADALAPSDLANMASAHDVFNALKTSWDMALAKGSKVLALTVPECHAKVKWLNASRRALNASILAHEQTNL